MTSPVAADARVHRFHAVEKAVAPVHERLRVDVLVVLDEIEAALQRFVDDAAVVAAREAELRLGRGAEQRPAELVEPLALDDDAGRRALERLQVRDRNAHVFEAQRLHGLEAEHVADDRSREVRDRARLEEIEVVRDVGEILLLGLGAGPCSAPDRRDRPWRDRARRRSGGRSRPPSRSPSTIRRRPRRPLRRLDAGLRRDAEQRDDVGVLRLVVGLPVAHLLVLHDAGRIALLASVMTASSTGWSTRPPADNESGRRCQGSRDVRIVCHPPRIWKLKKIPKE